MNRLSKTTSMLLILMATIEISQIWACIISLTDCCFVVFTKTWPPDLVKYSQVGSDGIWCTDWKLKDWKYLTLSKTQWCSFSLNHHSVLMTVNIFCSILNVQASIPSIAYTFTYYRLWISKLPCQLIKYNLISSKFPVTTRFDFPSTVSEALELNSHSYTSGLTSI